MRRYQWAYIYIIPALVLLFFILLYPLAETFYLSFTEKKVGEEVSNLSIRSYVQVIRDLRFYKSYLKSLVFTGSAVGLKLIIGLLLALLLNSIKIKSVSRFLRTLFFIPWTFPWFSTAILFFWIFRFFGGLNLVITRMGLPPVEWLGMKYALISGVIANVWKGYPFFMMSIYAGLQTIPKELYEAAEIDGANVLQRFLYVTLPNLRNVIIITTSLSTLWTFGLYELLYIMTRGGPGDASKVLPILVYETSFRQFEIGKGAAIAVLTLPFVILMIGILLRFTKEEEV